MFWKCAPVTRSAGPQWFPLGVLEVLTPDQINLTFLVFHRVYFPPTRACRRAERLQEYGNLVVEDSPLVIHYDTSTGGRRGQHETKHLRNNLEAIMIAHRLPAKDGKPCTINEGVIPSDVWGTSRGQPSLQFMTDFNYPAGAPNGGPRVNFPARAIHLLVNRLG